MSKVVIPRGFSKMRCNPCNPIKRPNVISKVTNSLIEVRYNKTVAIDYIHMEIIKRLDSKVGLEELRSERMSLERSLNVIHTLTSERNIRDRIAEIDRGIEFIDSGSKLDEYLSLTEEIILEFIELPPLIQFITVEDDTFNQLTEDDIIRMSIIDRFFEIAKSYAPIKVIRENVINKDCCINCNFSLINVHISEEGQQECPRCNNIICVFSMAGHKGIKSGGGNRCYDVTNTYKREILQFIGESRVDIPDDVYRKLRLYFRKKKFPEPEVIKTLPLDKYGKRKYTSLIILHDALKEIGYPSLYKHANKIGKEFWGWKLHTELKDMIPLLLEDFKYTQKFFPLIDKGSRTSNMCSQHRLLRQLMHRDVCVAITDFKLPNDEALLASERMWKQLCELSSIEYKPLFDNINTREIRKGFAIVKSEEVTTEIGVIEQESAVEES